MNKTPEVPEFSRPLELERIGSTELREDIAATAEERAALARRFGLLALDRLSARLRIRRVGRGIVRLEGAFVAELTQSCVITLAPVRSHLSETFVQLYAPPEAGRRPAAGEAVVVDPEAEDPPETLHGEVLDLGEAVAQQLAVAIEPYPRAPGARLEAAAAGEEAPGEEVAGTGPFADLAALKRRG